MYFKFFALSLVNLHFSSSVWASIAPESMIGSFRVGTCSDPTYQQATIEKDQENQVENLRITFISENQANTTYIFLKETTVAMNTVNVEASNFTIFNTYIAPVDSTKVQTFKIGRSASGGRVRITVLDAADRKSFECVLYKNLN